MGCYVGEPCRTRAGLLSHQMRHVTRRPPFQPQAHTSLDCDESRWLQPPDPTGLSLLCTEAGPSQGHYRPLTNREVATSSVKGLYEES